MHALLFGSLISAVDPVAVSTKTRAIHCLIHSCFIRCREHLGINKAGQKIKSDCSAIGSHISKSGRLGSLENFDVLSKIENSFDFYIHKSL